jgi:inorganic phosphate transporter, PiT family
MDFFILGAVAIVGLYMAWTIGANDAANSMANAVGSKSLSIKQAVILAGVCEFAGAVLVGGHVTDTVRQGIVDPNALAMLPGLREGEPATLMVIGMSGALLATAIWLHLATWKGMPVSTTHAIVGAIAGFGIVAAGWGSVQWGRMGMIVSSWFISPLAGGLLGFLFFKYISRSILGQEKPVEAALRHTPGIVFFLAMVVTLATIYKGLDRVIGGLAWLTDTHSFLFAVLLSLTCTIAFREFLHFRLRGREKEPLAAQLGAVESVYIPLLVASSCTVAFAHGANDVANAVGPLAAVVQVMRTGLVEMQVPVPFWVLILGGAGIVLGLLTYGYRVMSTVGTKITEITPTRGVAAGIAATFAVLVCTRLGLPVSTTHTLVGAVIGIGLARGLAGINKEIAKKIFKSWLVTVPAAAAISIGFFLLGRYFLFDIVHGIVLASLNG